MKQGEWKTSPTDLPDEAKLLWANEESILAKSLQQLHEATESAQRLGRKPLAS